MRKKTTATVLGAALLIGTGQAAVAAQDVEVLVPPDVVTTDPWVVVGDYELTDGAVYFTVGITFDDGNPGADIWRRDLLPTTDGVALGNAEWVGTTITPHWDSGMASVGDGIVFADTWQGGKLGRLDDDGTRTALSTDRVQPVESASASWYTSVDHLWPLAEDGPGGARLTGLADDWDSLPWEPDQTTSRTVDSAVSETVVVWQERLQENGGEGVAIRLYANRIDANGLVGEPVLLASNDDPNAGGVTPLGDIVVSDTTIAWTAGSWTADGVQVQWVPVADLTAEPTVIPQASRPDLDGSRLGFVVWDSPDAADTASVVDTATGTTVATWDAVHAWDIELRGDLAAVGVMRGEAEGLQLHSISGETDVTTVPQFDDIAYSPFVRQIDAIALDGITTGYPDGTFRPMGSVTREAMAAFLYRQAGEPEFTAPATSPFTDVSTGHPFYTEICWLADEGISTGWTMADGTAQYRPGQPVSREAMAAFLHRFAGEQEPAGTGTGFVDVSAGHPFADAIAWLAQTGISTGWSTPAGAEFRPGASIERQAMAAFLDRFGDRLE